MFNLFFQCHLLVVTKYLHSFFASVFAFSCSSSTTSNMAIIFQSLCFFALAQLAVAGPLAYRATVHAPVIKSSTPVQNIISSFPWGIRRDGGGGGTIDGKHIINFADTTTVNLQADKDFGFFPFISNSIAIASEVSRNFRPQLERRSGLSSKSRTEYMSPTQVSRTMSSSSRCGPSPRARHQSMAKQAKKTS